MLRGAHHLQRRSEESARDLALVDVEGSSRRRGQHEQRVGADDHRHRKPLAGGGGSLQQSPEIAPGVQARAERRGGGHHRAVVAEVATAAFAVLGDHDPTGDVGAPVGLEMGQQRQLEEVDAVAGLDPVGDWPAVALGHGHGRRGQVLVAVVELSGAGAQHPLDAHPGREEVGHDLPVGALHAPEPQHRMPAPLGQLPHDRGDVLVQRDRPIDDVDVGRVGGLVGAEEVFEGPDRSRRPTALALGGRAGRRHGLMRIPPRSARGTRPTGRDPGPFR